MKKTALWQLCPALLLAWTLLPGQAAAQQNQCVVLLHGLSRTDFSMQRLEEALEDAGYSVANIGYDSRHHGIEELAVTAMEQGTDLCRALQAGRIHFATHSLGGILVRYYLDHHDINELGRVVMMAPPNGGSELIDVFGEWPGFSLVSGEPAQQLGTNTGSLPVQLGPVHFELGVIAGTRSLNPLTSMTLPDDDDGKVTVENTKVEGMQDFIALPYTHTFIMVRREAIEQVIHFLGNGHFQRPDHRADAGF
ncbi:MAG: alpha/beta fold hydrolase [Pseudohongiellaceae bacterium]